MNINRNVRILFERRVLHYFKPNITSTRTNNDHKFVAHHENNSAYNKVNKQSLSIIVTFEKILLNFIILLFD